MADKPTQNPAVQPPADPANLGANQLRPVDVSKDFDVDPRTGVVTPKAPGSLPEKPATSQTIEQPKPGDPGFESFMATQREQNTSGALAESIPAGGVDVGTPEQNVQQAKPEAGNQQGDLRNPQPQGPRTINEVATGAAHQLVDRYKRALTPSSLSSSEAVRDYQGSWRMPTDTGKAGREAARKRVEEIVDLATGKTQGMTGKPAIDAMLAAINLPSEVSGDVLSQILKDSGVTPDIADDIGLATGVAGSLIYGAKAPVLAGAPGALGRYAKSIGLIGQSATSMRDAAALARTVAREGRESQFNLLALNAEEGLKKSGGATVNLGRGVVEIAPDQAAVSLVPGRSKVIDGDATAAQIKAFAKENADILDAYPDINIGMWKDAETGKTHFDLSAVTDPENAVRLGQANRQKSIYLGTGESVRVPHTYSIDEGAKGHGYAPTEKMRAEDVAVAKEYDAAPTVDPEAVPAWRELIDKVRQDVERNILPRLQVEQVHGQPYASAQEMNADIAAGRLKVSVDNSEHPVWTQDENILFRIWHDYKQHFENGADFSLEGEWRAFKTAEMGMSPAARKALQVEIYGQAAAAVAHSGEFQVQKIYLPGKTYAAQDTLTEQLAGLRREQVTVPHSSIADTLEAAAAHELADEPQGIPVFHGTNAAFDKAQTNEGFWVAEGPGVANRYAELRAQEGGAANVRPYYLDPNAKLAPQSLYEDLTATAGYDFEGRKKAAEELLAQGYQGVAFEDQITGKGKHYLVFDPNILIEKFTGQRAATMAMIAAAGAAAAAASGEDQGAAPLGAMAGVAAVMGTKGRGAKILSRGEQLAKETEGSLRYLTKPVEWDKVAKNSKEVGALASVGAAMIARGEAKGVEILPALVQRFGPGVMKHADRIVEEAARRFEDAIKGIDLRPVEEVIDYFKKGEVLPDWYSSGERVRQAFGPDADLVASLIASTSAHNSNERSVSSALEIYVAYKTGKIDPNVEGSVRSWLEKESKGVLQGISMETHFNNVERSFLGQELSGNKVWNYKRAILGDENAVVIDSHIVNALLPDLKKLKEAVALGETPPDWVTETVDGVERVISAKKIDLSKDHVYQYFEDIVRKIAEDQGVTPRFAQQAIWVGRVQAEGRVAESVTPLVDMFKDVAKQRGYDSMFPGLSGGESKGLATLGFAAGLIAAANAGAGESGVTPDHIEAGFPGVGGNRQLMKVLIEAVRRLRNIPGKVHELPPAAAEVALDVLTAPKAQIKAGDKLLGMDWVGMAQDADHLPNTIKTVREVFDAQLKANSRGVVSHELERKMAQTMTELGYDKEAAMAKWQEGGRAVVSTEIMATAALTKAAYGETERLAQLALKTGSPADLDNWGRQLGVFGSLVQVLDGQAEEAGRALGIFRAMVPDLPKEARAFAGKEMALAEKGMSPMGGKVAEQATAGSRQAGAIQGPPSPQAVTTAGNTMIQNAQQMQAQYLQTLLQAWNQLPKSQQRGAFIRELGRWGLDFIKELFYNSMLFTFPGQLANAVGNTMSVMGEQMSRIVGAGIGAVRHDVLGLGPAGTSLQQITAGSFKGMLDSITEAFVVAGKSFVEGTPQSKGVMDKSITKTPYAISGERVADVAALAGYQLPNAVYHGINVLGMTLGAGTRSMMAGDEWMKVVNFRGELKRLGIAEAERQGLTGRAYTDFMIQWAQSPDAVAVKAAKDYAHYITYTQPLEGVMAKIGAVGHSTMMTPFTPFFDTLVNVQKYELEWIPVLNALVKKSREDLAHMGPRQDQALAKLGMGSAMMVAAFSLYQAGYLTGPGPSDKNVLKVMKEVNGYQENSFVFTGSDGKKHYIGINRFDPVNFPFTFAAAYGDIALESLNGRGVSQETLAELALAGVHALGEVAMTRNYAQGFQQAIEQITAKDMSAYNKLQKIGQRMAGQVVPSGVAQINKEIDQYQRATYSALDAIYARLPGKSSSLMPEVNLAGQPRFKTAALGPDWISPIPYSEGKPDVVGQEILKNGISIDAPPKSLFGPPPPPLVGEENSAHGILLNAKQYYRYATLAGNELKVSSSTIEPALRAIGYRGDLPNEKMGMWDILTAVVKSKGYKELANDADPESAEPGPRSAQAKVIRSIVQGYRRAAAGQMLREDKDLREKFFGKVLDRAESFGGPRARAQAEQAIKSMDMDTILGMTGIE